MDALLQNQQFCVMQKSKLHIQYVIISLTKHKSMVTVLMHHSYPSLVLKHQYAHFIQAFKETTVNSLRPSDAYICQ